MAEEEKRKIGEEILLDYIEAILDNPGEARLNLAQLPEEMRLLGRGLEDLAAYIVEQQRLLEASAYTDSLTGVGNRLAFDRQVYKLWEERLACTVAFIDMDDLKHCNDHSGHSEGDYYIKSVSNLLHGFCREGEQLYRVGGDEFVILSLHATEKELSERLERARDAYVADMKKRVRYKCGFSYGCTHVTESIPDAYNNLLAEADQKMYEYKERCKKQQALAAREKQAKDVYEENYGLESRLFDALSMTMRHRHYLYVCNMRTNMSRWSKSAVQDFDLPGEYMFDAGNIWLECIHPDDRQLYLDDIGNVFNGKSLFHDCVYRAKDANGYYVRCTCNGYRLKGEGEEPDLFVGTIQNHGVIENVDPVTNLYNVYEFLNQLKRIQKERVPAEILVIGISGFHLVNDTYGYENGNKILLDLAQQMQNLATEDTMLFRLNGMKLAFVLPCSSRSIVRQLYETALYIIQNELRLDGETVKLFVAATAVHYEGTDDDGSTLLSELDYLIDMSKKEKSGELIYVDEQPDDNPRQRLEILGAVKRGIVNDCEGFYLVYQPQIDFDGSVIGAEALLRWSNVTYGVVPPNEFIPWIEGDICFYDLGLWILRRAMTDGLGMIRNNPKFAVSVNISYRQLERESFLEDVLEILHQTGFPPENLVLEFTEHCRTLDPERLEQIVEFFNNHKIRIAADDFGTGYSALMLLRNIHFDTIKIDQNFIRGMLNNSTDRIIVNTIIDCAHKLETKVCVEGVENQDLMVITRGYAAEYYQGYLIAKPLELGALQVFLESWQPHGAQGE